MGWMYYWGSVKFHELRAVMTNITYIAFALVELFSSINNWNIDIMYCNCIHYLKLSFSKAQKPFKIRLLNHHRRLLSVMSSKNNTRTGSAYWVNEIEMSQAFQFSKFRTSGDPRSLGSWYIK